MCDLLQAQKKQGFSSRFRTDATSTDSSQHPVRHRRIVVDPFSTVICAFRDENQHSSSAGKHGQIRIHHRKNCGSSQPNATPFSVSKTPEPCFFPFVRKQTHKQREGVGEKGLLNPLPRPISHKCLYKWLHRKILSVYPAASLPLFLLCISFSSSNQKQPERLHFQASRNVMK